MMFPPVAIAPSILSGDFANLARDVRALVAGGSDYLHVDVMDGRFVPNITIGQGVVAALARVSTVPLDVHLMIAHPEQHIETFAAAGADIITVHVEACAHLHRVIQAIRGCGKRVGVALNPATPLEALRWVLADVDLILLMSVNPGFGGQAFIPATLAKLRALRQMIAAAGVQVDVEVDGGVTGANVAEVTAAGANVIVSGTGILGTEDWAAAIAALRAAGQQGQARAAAGAV